MMPIASPQERSLPYVRTILNGAEGVLCPLVARLANNQVNPTPLDGLLTQKSKS
jgi:hypothetical protein